MDVKENNLCPYLIDNRNTDYILKPTDRILLCKNFSCPYGNNFGRYLYEGEGKPIGICVSQGLVQAEGVDDLIARIIQGVINVKARNLKQFQFLS